MSDEKATPAAGTAGPDPSAAPDAPEGPKVKSTILVLTLTLAGLFSGLAIVGAYTLTLPRITENKAKALRAAVFEVVPGARQLQPLVWDGAQLSPAAKDVPGSTVFAAYDSVGSFQGYAIPSEGAGFQDNIRLIYGYVPESRRIVGMRVLESRETPGLGDKIYKDKHFVNEFRDLAAEPEVVAVKGHGPNPNEVDAITGATISSKSVVKIVNGGNATWVPRLPPSGQEPPHPGGGQ